MAKLSGPLEPSLAQPSKGVIGTLISQDKYRLNPMVPSARTSILDEALTGPIARAAGLFFLMVGGLSHFNGFSHPPSLATLLALVAVGLLLLVNQTHLRHFVVSVPGVMLLLWIALSISWSEDVERTTFLVRIEMPYLLGFMILGALASEQFIARGLLWMVRLSVVISTLATIAIPSTRGAVQSNGDALEGWHALFEHKNEFGPFLALSFGIVLVEDQRRIVRNITLLTIFGLTLGSQSVTALTTILVIVAIHLWLRVNRGLDGPAAAAAVFGAAALAIGGALGSRASLPLILEATGKDPTFSGRTDIWSAVIQAISDQPLLGYGRGGLFFPPANEQTASLWRDIGFQAPHAHNGVLDLWLQLGLVGVALYALIFFSSFRVLFNSYRRGERFGPLGLLVMVSIGVASLSEPLYLGPYLSTLVLFNVVGLRLDRKARHQEIRALTNESAPSNQVVAAASALDQGAP